MSQPLTFYTNPMSRGRMVRWMLEEVGQPYDTKLLDYATDLKSPAYLAINPMGKIPAIVHGATIVTEVSAICAYLADAFPEAGLAPAHGSPARGPYYRWLFFGAGPVEAAITNKSCGFELPPEKSRMAGYGSLELTMNTLAMAVSATPYLAGEHFSAADVYVGSQIGFGLRFGSITPRPEFSAYWDRLKTRPAAIRAAAIDDALLKPAS
jgi:glutathione S-transferase